MPAAFCHCFRPSFGLCFTVDLRCDLENISKYVGLLVIDT